MSKHQVSVAAIALLLAMGAISETRAQPANAAQTTDGVLHVPAFDLPPSGFLSREAVEHLKKAPPIGAPLGADIAEMRRNLEHDLVPSIAYLTARYPAEIVQRKIGGVPTRVFTPKGRKVDPRRVLIQLHGGAFMVCADACSITESLPIAYLGGFKVISVDYRQGPEATFPAGSEDVAKVYREMLKTYKPHQIGIFGCSAGGVLSAQVAAWLPAHGLPQAGAIGVFGAGAAQFVRGDSAYLGGALEAAEAGRRPAGSGAMPRIRSYWEGADLTSAMASPALHPDVLAKFPPTLVITGTRAPDLSTAVFTHSALIKAGVPGDLIVGEGLGHCYHTSEPELPESRDTYDAIVKFFQKYLG